MKFSNFQCGRYRFELNKDRMPLVMGILNVTPDSFSDGGRFQALESALSHAESMIEAGVDIIDIGAESTRPGATSLSIDEELRRLLPVVFALRDCGKPISIDTRNPVVMREVLAAGVDMINDVNGFRHVDALTTVKGSECGLCIMHMLHGPQTMQIDPTYRNVVSEVANFLLSQVDNFEQAGVAGERLCIDPGFGFGKTLSHNLALLKSIAEISNLIGRPVLAGVSRKSMIGALTGRAVEDRLAGSLAGALAATVNGASILRVHDVAETIDALKVFLAATPVGASVQ